MLSATRRRCCCCGRRSARALRSPNASSLARRHAAARGALPADRASHAAASEFAPGERVLDLAELLAQARKEAGSDLIFQDDLEHEPVWEHEARFVNNRPLTAAELAAPEPQLFADPASAVAGVLSAYDEAAGFRQLSAEELEVSLASGLLDLVLDVRSEAEFDAGPRIPGARNIPLERLSAAVRAGQLDGHMNSHLAVVCASGQRSAQATVRLTKVFAFAHVAHVAGGMAAVAQRSSGSSSSSSSSQGAGCGCGGGGGGGCHSSA